MSLVPFSPPQVFEQSLFLHDKFYTVKMSLRVSSLFFGASDRIPEPEEEEEVDLELKFAKNTFLHFYISTFLHFYISTFLHFYIFTFLHFYIFTSV